VSTSEVGRRFVGENQAIPTGRNRHRHVASAQRRDRAGASGQTVSPTARVDKVLLSITESNVHDVAHDLLGCEFLFEARRRPNSGGADWWYSRSATILGGSAEMQRTFSPITCCSCQRSRS
jgi:hypothetical protein